MRDDALSQRLNEICQQLGYADSKTFVTAATWGSGKSHVLREAFRTIGIAAVFGLAGSLEPSAARPVVYLATAEDPDRVQQIRKGVWTQGVAPFLIIVSPGSLTLCSGFEPPSERALTYDDDGTVPERLAALSAARLRSSLAWQDFDVAMAASVDNRLIKAIDALNTAARKLNPDLADRRSLVNAAIGRFLYLYVLIDRGILHERWLADASPDEGAKLFAHAVCTEGKEIAWTAADAFRALDAVDCAINGSVFPITDDERLLLTDDVCHLIHEVLRTGLKVQAVGGQQLDFFDVSYEVLRTETISAIYERFVAIEDGSQKSRDGVFYTPPHLADHVLDLVEQIDPLTERSRIIDPAAGSGVFLVGAYRRIMERAVPSDGWSERHIHRAHDLLQRCIYGTEKHRQAANVCRFSLYLTLLDYVGRAPIETLTLAAGDVKFLPSLDDNILATNAFTLAQDRPSYTHVIGNPPWARTTGHRSRANVRDDLREEALDPATATFIASLDRRSEPVGHDRLSDMFVWLAKKHLALAGGVIAFALPARSLVARQSNHLPHAIACAMTPVFVGNLSHLRRKLFVGADAPAMIVVLRNRPAQSGDRVAVYRPLLTSLPIGRTRDIWALFLAQADMQYFRVEDLRTGSSGWYEQTMLRTLDRRTRSALATWARIRARTFGDFLARSGLTIVKGLSPGDSGLSRRVAGGDKDERVVPLSRGELGRAVPRYRARFSGNVILVPRSLGTAVYYATPCNYASTYNAILPQAQEDDPAFDPWPANPHILPDATIRALLQYLNAPILRYFAALFGSGHLTDTARFEMRELLSVPCPYESASDPDFLALGDEADADAGILTAIGAGDEFRMAYRDFRDFRRQFGNARIPEQGFAMPPSKSVAAYLGRLDAEIRSALPREMPIQVDVEAVDGTPVPRAIHLRFNHEAIFDLDPPASRFLATSIVEITADGGSVVIWKSTPRHAWTIDQAVADAQVVIRELHHHDVKHRTTAANA